MDEIYQRRWSEEATTDDIYYCYRLLLGREPGQEGLRFWTRRLETEPFTYSKLAAYFRKSREYQTSKRARGIKLVALDDFELYVFEHDWDIGEQIVLTRQYEPQVTAFLKQHLHEGMTFVDVGANIGYFTLLGAKLVERSGRVVAVECNPRNCELIYMSLHWNNFNGVLVYPFAVSDHRKLMRFTSGFSNGAVDELAADDDESVIVPAITLDSVLRAEPRIDIIKMDIEGSEAKAWRGMRETIEKHHPIILMEFFPALLKQNSGANAAEFLEDIFACGYEASILHPAGDETPEATTPAGVMKAWEKQCELVGDDAVAYLDLAFHRRQAA